MIGNATLDHYRQRYIYIYIYVYLGTIKNQITSNHLTPIVIPRNNKKHLTRWHKKGIHVYSNTIQLVIVLSLYVWLNNEIITTSKLLLFQE